jgi:hypothetical protein
MRRWLIPLLSALTLASPAEAAPLVAAIGSFASTVGAFFAASPLLQIAGRLLLSVALSALQRALMPKPREPGIKTKVTQTGGTNPQAFPLHKVATAGTFACPPMSHGSVGKTPNAYLTYVVVLSDVAGAALSRYMINGQYVSLGGVAHPDYGLPVTGDLNGFAWIKVYTGLQTAADPMLLSKYGLYPERPWTSDMIGRGLVYAICTFKYNREKLPGLPRVRFELEGIPLYDPRKDTTVGGSGPHRWANKATWEPSVNPSVGTYNLLRGVALDDGSVYGGNFPAEDVPLASWFAAMNECDLAVTNGTGTEMQFRAGIEVAVDEEPADIIGELMKVSVGNIAEIGGLWKTRVGPPGTPVYLFTDADVVSSSPQDFTPFPNMAGSYNGAHATYPDPDKAWESAEATPYYNATHEAADRGFRLTADLNLVACPYPAQVRRLQYAYVEEERRFRRHEHTLPPDAAIVEPLDATGWTSTWNGYTSKVFEIDQVAEDVLAGLQRVMLKERDAADYSYPGLPAPTPISILPVIPATQTLPSFAVSGTSIEDATGADRRPALSLTWEPDLADVTGVMWEVRVQATAVIAARGSTQDVATGALLVSEGVVASTAYEVRARPVCDRPSDWTVWTAATTPDTLITSPDLAEGSVTIQVQTVALGPFTRADLPTNTVVATLDIGAIDSGQGWERRIHFEAQKAGAASPAFELAFQRRSKVLGGGFSSWTTLESWTLPGPQSWDMYADSGTLAGKYDDFEYRLIVIQSPTGIAGTNEILREVYVTAVRVTK